MEPSFSQLLRSIREEGQWRRAFRQDLCTELDSLGDSAKQVASRLLAKGVRGSPRDSKDCAVARYLGAVVGSDPLVTEIEVTARRVQVMTKRRRGRVVVDLPPAVCAFVNAFDRLSYPELLASPALRAASDTRRAQLVENAKNAPAEPSVERTTHDPVIVH